MEIDDGNSSMIYKVFKFSLHVIKHYNNLIERAKKCNMKPYVYAFPICINLVYE